MLEQESQADENMDGKGCTANVCLIVPKKDGSRDVYCANAGDSRALLSSGGKAVALSFDHKPTNPRERQRITKAGSYVNAEGRIEGNLNLSRAIGDLEYKKRPRLRLQDQPITSLPDVKKITLGPSNDFLVMGCDGIYEFHNN